RDRRKPLQEGSIARDVIGMPMGIQDRDEVEFRAFQNVEDLVRVEPGVDDEGFVEVVAPEDVGNLRERSGFDRLDRVAPAHVRSFVTSPLATRQSYNGDAVSCPQTRLDRDYPSRLG